MNSPIDRDDNKIKELRDEIIESLLPSFRNSTYEIINQKIDDITIIERQLEELLTYIDHDGIRLEFRKLNTYLYKIDPKKANSYWNHYDSYMVIKTGSLSL